MTFREKLGKSYRDTTITYMRAAFAKIEKEGCKTVTLSGLATPYTIGPFIFGDNVITTGGQF